MPINGVGRLKFVSLEEDVELRDNCLSIGAQTLGGNFIDGVWTSLRFDEVKIIIAVFAVGCSGKLTPGLDNYCSFLNHRLLLFPSLPQNSPPELFQPRIPRFVFSTRGSTDGPFASGPFSELSKFPEERDPVFPFIHDRIGDARCSSQDLQDHLSRIAGAQESSFACESLKRFGNGLPLAGIDEAVDHLPEGSWRIDGGKFL